MSHDSLPLEWSEVSERGTWFTFQTVAKSPFGGSEKPLRNRGKRRSSISSFIHLMSVIKRKPAQKDTGAEELITGQGMTCLWNK